MNGLGYWLESSTKPNNSEGEVRDKENLSRKSNLKWVSTIEFHKHKQKKTSKTRQPYYSSSSNVKISPLFLKNDDKLNQDTGTFN